MPRGKSKNVRALVALLRRLKADRRMNSEQIEMAAREVRKLHRAIQTGDRSRASSALGRLARLFLSASLDFE